MKTYDENKLIEIYKNNLDEIFGNVSVMGKTYKTSEVVEQMDNGLDNCDFEEWRAANYVDCGNFYISKEDDKNIVEEAKDKLEIYKNFCPNCGNSCLEVNLDECDEEDLETNSIVYCPDCEKWMCVHETNDEKEEKERLTRKKIAEKSVCSVCGGDIAPYSDKLMENGELFPFSCSECDTGFTKEALVKRKK